MGEGNLEIINSFIKHHVSTVWQVMFPALGEISELTEIPNLMELRMLPYSKIRKMKQKKKKKGEITPLKQHIWRESTQE